MATPQDIQRILDQLNSTYRQLGESNPFANFDASNITNASREAQRLTDALAGAEQRLRAIDNNLDDLVGAFKAITGELSKQNVALNNTNASFRGLTSLASKLRDDQVGINKLSRKEIEGIKEKIKSKQKELEDNRDLLKNKRDQLIADGASQDIIDRHISALASVNAELEEEDSLTKSLLKTAEDRLLVEEKIDKAMGLGGATINGIKGALDKLGMGGLSKTLGLDEAQEKMRDIASEVTKGGTEATDFAGKMKILKGGAASVGKSIITNLKDPMVLVTFVANQLITALKGSDAAAADMAKGLNMSYKEALSTRRQLTEMAGASLNNFVNTRGMQESLVAVNKSLGTNVMLSSDMLVQFTEMREMAGFTNEELQGVAAISLTTGKSMNEVTGEFMAQAKLSSVKNGVLLNEKDLLKSIKDVSAATTLSLGKNPKLIGEAVATAKSLGMELSQVDAIAGSLLDFESSIENELSAELLLNKDLNLEKARQAALNNDLATVAKEISEQAGSAAEFGEMNRIQQEALAKSVGMSREDLAKTLFVQEQLTGLTGDAAKEQEDLLNKRIEEVGLAQAQKELAEEGVEGLRDQAGMADKFAATMEKVQELFVMLADPILVIADAFSPILEGVAWLIGGISKLSELATSFGEKITEWSSNLGAIGSVLRGIGYLVVLLAGYGAYAALSLIPFVGPLLGAAAAAAIITSGFSAINSSPKKAGDMMSPADGKTQISTKEGGLFELSKNDDLIAAPGAASKMQGGGGTTVVKQDNSETNNLLKQLISTNQEGNSLQKKKPELSPIGLYEVQ